MGRRGLLWIGEKFYKSPADWTNESEKLGVSRRIPAVPREFVLGKTTVLVAHTKAIKTRCVDCYGRGFTVRTPTFADDKGDAFQGPPQKTECDAEGCDKGLILSAGIFSAFMPTAIEYVTKGTETTEELEAIIKRGITPIKVVRKDDPEEGA